MEAHRFSCLLPVLGHMVDPRGRLYPHRLHDWLQEVGYRASADRGFDMRWYRTHRRGWLMRRVEVSVRRWPESGQWLQAETWVCAFGGTRSERVYRFRDAESAEPLLDALVEWVFFDLQRQRPVEIPDAFAASFGMPGPHPELSPLPIQDGDVVDSAGLWQVGYTDLDEHGHVNNARYVAWWTEHSRRLALWDRVPDRWRVHFRRPAHEGEHLQAVYVSAPGPAGGRIWRWQMSASGRLCVEITAYWKE
jgi:acyl-CoA thioesterase FadM|nr:MAG: hypothetical protein KatS3mg041_1138 [Bacteroidota bacterium]